MKKTKYIFFLIIVSLFSCKEDVKVVLSKTLLKSKINIIEEGVVYNKKNDRNENVVICKKAIKNLLIDSVYIKNGDIVGFSYNIESANLGIARILNSNNIITIDFFSQFDVSIDKVVKPSFSLYFKKIQNSYICFTNLIPDFQEINEIDTLLTDTSSNVK